jgi:hypothetical protein
VEKNVDRLIKVGEYKYIAATYHLNKEEQTKSGSLIPVEIEANK